MCNNKALVVSTPYTVLEQKAFTHPPYDWHGRVAQRGKCTTFQTNEGRFRRVRRDRQLAVDGLRRFCKTKANFRFTSLHIFSLLGETSDIWQRNVLSPVRESREQEKNMFTWYIYHITNKQTQMDITCSKDCGHCIFFNITAAIINGFVQFRCK